jgi:hypothetical protein
MRKTTLAMMMALTMTGCGAAKSAMSALTGSKPNQVNVVTHVETQPVVVNVQPAPVVVQPVAAPKRESRFASLKALAVGAGAGALVGTAVGYAVDGKRGAQHGAAIGAGAGAVSGVAVEAAR